MKLVVYIMHDKSKLENFLHLCNENDIKGATIINSTGMARKLIENDDMEFIGSLKVLFDNPRAESHMIFMVLEDNLVDLAIKIIHQVAGDMTKPNTGIVFTMPIDYFEGLMK